MRDIDIREQSAAVKKYRPIAERIVLKRLPASQRLIIEREGERIKALMHSIRAADGHDTKVMFGPVSQRELLAKLGRWMIINEVFELMKWNEVD